MMRIILNIVFLVALSVNATAQTVSTFAGTGTAGSSDNDGQAINAQLNHPYGITADDNGNVYFVDQSNARIRKIDDNGFITTILSSNEIPNFTPNTIEFYNGSLYFINYYSTSGSTIYKYELAISLLTSIYSAANTNYSDLVVVNNDSIFLSKEVGTYYQIDLMYNVGILPQIYSNYSSYNSNQYQYNYSIITDMLILNPGQLLVLHTNTTGNFGEVLGIDYYNAFSPVDPLTLTPYSLMFPEGFTKNAQNEIFIADQGANKIFKFLTNGTLTTYAGTGTAGFVNGDANIAQFNKPNKIVAYGLGELLISDYFNNVIRRITSCTPADLPSITNVPYNPDDCPSEIAFYVESTSDLNDNTDWAWYGDACGQGYLFSGDTVFVNSQIAQSFYVRGENGCGLNGDCITFEYESLDCTPTQIDSNDQFKKLITTAFSPNKDGVNDVWVIDSIQPNTTVRIYNRWGDLVKKIDNYDNVEKVWDGTNFLNQKVHSGTYFYTIEKNNIKITSGWIEVVR